MDESKWPLIKMRLLVISLNVYNKSKTAEEPFINDV